MSPQLQGEVCMRILGRQLESVPFLQNVERELLLLVATSLEPAVFAPGELATPGHLYFLHKGIALYGGRVLTSGRVWGHDMILSRQELCHFSARAMSYLEVYRLSRADLVEIARPFPVAWSRIRWAAFRLAFIRTVVHTKRSLQLEQQADARSRGEACDSSSGAGQAAGAWQSLFELAAPDPTVLAARIKERGSRELAPPAVIERVTLTTIGDDMRELRTQVAAIKAKTAPSNPPSPVAAPTPGEAPPPVPVQL